MLLSALSGKPVRQGLAITGSVNQKGRIQAIGGVNEKIEGFFDICRQRGLRGLQGVIIPKSNVQHLMLRDDVRAAVAKGSFRIYPIETVEEGIQLLTGTAAGMADGKGVYPPKTVYRLVADRLEGYAKTAREQAMHTDGDGNAKGRKK